MAGFGSYVTTNDEEFRKSIDAALNAVGDLRTPFNLIANDFYRSQKAIFQLTGPGQYPPFKRSAGAYKSGKFSTQTESQYQARKKKAVGFDYPLLVRSGKLAASLAGPGNSGNVTVISPLTLILGTTIAYGVYHQSDEPRRVIPLRKFLFIGPEAPRFAIGDTKGRLQRWTGYLTDYVERKMRAGQ